MKKILLSLTAFVFSAIALANNIQLANVALSGQNTASQFSLINFDVSWENSWRTITNENNYDGAWIFVKFRKKTSSLWQHATINATGSTVPANSVVQTSIDGKGVWIYRALPGADFSGNVNYAGAKIRWNYGVDGVMNTDSVEIRVFALEMVYIPQGAFVLGTGGSEVNHFIDGNTNNTYTVSSNSAIPIANTPGSLYYFSSGNGANGDGLGPVPGPFPKGFNAFWIMKYESSQQQYVDFLNNIDLAKATNRNPGNLTGSHPNFTAPFPERAMSGLSIPDHLALTDWEGLRPFTELEYEKTCRGAGQVPIPNEFPWGNTVIAATTSTSNTGLINETANDGNANYGNNYLLPTRTGIYATAVSTRQSSGGAYYGVLDMAGNESEICVSIGRPFGRSFDDTNGDGNLDVNGDANTPAWPNVGQGYSIRGGGYSDLVGTLRTSDRTQGMYNSTYVTRYNAFGSRSARTAE